jgi:hypothetical protein
MIPALCQTNMCLELAQFWCLAIVQELAQRGISQQRPDIAYKKSSHPSGLFSLKHIEKGSIWQSTEPIPAKRSFLPPDFQNLVNALHPEVPSMCSIDTKLFFTSDLPLTKNYFSSSCHLTLTPSSALKTGAWVQWTRID